MTTRCRGVGIRRTAQWARLEPLPPQGIKPGLPRCGRGGNRRRRTGFGRWPCTTARTSRHAAPHGRSGRPLLLIVSEWGRRSVVVEPLKDLREITTIEQTSQPVRDVVDACVSNDEAVGAPEAAAAQSFAGGRPAQPPHSRGRHRPGPRRRHHRPDAVLELRSRRRPRQPDQKCRSVRCLAAPALTCCVNESCWRYVLDRLLVHIDLGGHASKQQLQVPLHGGEPLVEVRVGIVEEPGVEAS